MEETITIIIPILLMKKLRPCTSLLVPVEPEGKHRSVCLCPSPPGGLPTAWEQPWVGLAGLSQGPS